MDIERRLRKLESKLLRPEIRQSPESLSSLLADDFCEFGSSGGVFSRDEALATLQTESRSQFSISNFHAKILGTGIALVTYKAVELDSLNHLQGASLRSSIWVVRDGRWQMLFHQGTRMPNT